MDFKEHLEKYLNKQEIENLCNSFCLKEHKGLILNVNKISEKAFIEMFPDVKKHPIVPNAFLYNQDTYQFGKHILHDLGAYYIQDPSASLVSYFLNPKPGMQVLDMCAAPGGKSIQASLLMKGQGILYSNDLSNSRSEILLSNIERLGLNNVVISSLDLSKIKGLNNKFDAIILDAPCSGSGMFRKSEEMKNDWTYEKVVKASYIQKELIKLAYSFLKEGGRLIYSTCSYSFEEDEEVVDYLLKNSDARLIDLPQNEMFYRSSILKETIHLFPHKFVGEGHYIALIEKPGNMVISEQNEVYKIQRKGVTKGGTKIIYNFTLPKKPIAELEKVCIRPGLFVSEEIGNKVINTHHNSHFENVTNSYPLNDDELKAYIHGETLRVNENKNYTAVSYLGMNLGAVNEVNGVLKNLYPKGLRR